MVDLDAELLALAGDNSSDDGKATEAPKADAKKRSPQKASTDDASRRSSPSPDAKKKLSNPPKSPESRKRTLSTSEGAEPGTKKTKNDDAVEAGRVSPALSTTSSMRSAPMSESDDGNNAPKEKARALPQSEIEREQALAEQATVAERGQRQLLLMQLLGKRHIGSAEAVEADAADKKRKATAVEAEDTQRKSARLKSAANARKGLERYTHSPESDRRQRERKSTPIEQKGKPESPKGRGAKKNESPSAADARAKANGDGKYGKQSSQSSQPRISSSPSAEELPTLKDFERVKLGRATLAELCFYPGFEETAIGCFGKVVIGVNSRGGNALKMGQIIRFEEGRPYAIENPNGGSLNIILTRHVVCVQGKHEKKLPFIYFSNSSLNEAEFAEYKQAADEASVAVPRKAFLQQKYEALHALRTRRWTEEELQEKLIKSGVIAERQSNIRRVTLRAERKDAERRHDTQAIRRINQEIMALNKGPVLGYGTTKYRSDSDAPPSEPVEPPQPTEAQKAEARKAEMRLWREKQYAELLAAQEEEESKKRSLKKRKFVPKPSSSKPAGEADGASGRASGSSGTGGRSPAAHDAKAAEPGESIDMAKLLALERAPYKTKSGLPGVGHAASYEDFMETIDLGIEIEL